MVKLLFHQCLQFVAQGEGIPCTMPHGEIVRVKPTHRSMSWDRLEYEAFKKCVRPGDIVLDVGANVGAYSTLFGQWVIPGGRVFAFEPIPSVCTVLKDHVRINRLQNVVTIVPVAVSDRQGTVAMIGAENSGCSRVANRAEIACGPNLLQVDSITLDAFCSAKGLLPNCLKIDVEGFEVNVLRGAREIIGQVSSEVAIFVELHPTRWPLLGTSKDELLDELRIQGLSFCTLNLSTPSWDEDWVYVRLVKGNDGMRQTPYRGSSSTDHS